MKFFVVSFAVLLLAACGQSKTQDYYVAHPAELAADLEECKKVGKNTFDCNEADKAAWILKNRNGGSGN